MPYRISEATDDVKAAVQAVEDRADGCYEQLRLLKRPANIARWSLLTAMALQLEMTQQKYGADSPQHNVRMVTLDRCTAGFKLISNHGRAVSRLNRKYVWEGNLIADANQAFNVAQSYASFEQAFPLWHRDADAVQLQPDGGVRFFIPNDSPRQRQVIAFQQRNYPKGERLITPYTNPRKPESDLAMHLLADLWRIARPDNSAKSFTYQPSRELIDSLRPKYEERLAENFRRPDSFQLSGYSLGEFKQFYIALLILCSIHEYICYPFDRFGHPIPVSSLLLVKTRPQWAATLSQISGVSKATCEAMIGHLTLDPVSQPGASMCIHPFVSLDGFALAVAPQFPLASAVDDNIIRSFSYTFPTLFSAQNTDKEESMRTRIHEVASRFVAGSSIDLPNGATEIDLILADEASSTVVLAEMKWCRKPNRTVERIDRDKEILKGVSQLGKIRSYARKYPDFLGARLPRRLDSYAHVHYLLIVWDHWLWVEPDDGFAIIPFDVLIPALSKATNLQETLDAVLQYEWLPVEGRDFKVTYASFVANGAVMESSIFTPVT